METDIITDGTTIFLQGGVIQNIIGIPKGGKVTVVDWDTDGVDPKDLTELMGGPAVVSVWRGEPLHPDEVINLAKLIEYMKSRDSLECYIQLEKGYKFGITIIKPDAESENIVVIKGPSGIEKEFKSLDDMAANHPGIREALFSKTFYVYGYELGGY